MIEKNKILAWRENSIRSFCEKAEKGTLIICDNASTEEQRALKET